MVWVSALEVLVASLAVALYTAVMEWLPTVRPVVENAAVPELVSVTVPRVAVPFLKVTLPVGMGPVEAVTPAVKVTEVPCTAGLWLEERVVWVTAGLTTCVSVAEVLAR